MGWKNIILHVHIILLLAVCKIAKILFYQFNEKTFPVEFYPYK